MTDNLAHYITTLFTGTIPKELIVFVISVIPVLELRGGLIAASILGISAWKATIFCVAGNLLPIPFILLFIQKIMDWCKTHRVCRRFFIWLEKHAMSKSEKIETCKFWGLVVFVGIPLPGTGAWTGAIIAALLGIGRKKALLAITLGVFMAALIMLCVAYVIPYFLAS